MEANLAQSESLLLVQYEPAMDEREKSMNMSLGHKDHGRHFVPQGT